MTNDFSLLMSVYGGDNPHQLNVALQSVSLSTTRPADVCIVIDGEIPASIKNVIASYENVLPLNIIQLERNMGLGQALSLALPHCRYEWVARFDSDDICVSNRFEKQIQFIKDNPDVDIFGSWISEFEYTPEKPHAIRKVPTEHADIIIYAKSRNPFNHMTIMYKKSVVLAAGGYQNNYLYEDYALWVRIISMGRKTANIPIPLVFARTGNGMEIRRGGFKYAYSELKAQLGFYELGFLNKHQLLRNLLIRLPIRLIPGGLRKTFYRRFFR